MNKLKILVLGVGGNVGIGILKVLKQSSTFSAEVYGACVNKNSAGFKFSDFALISPYANDPNFLPWLNRIVKNYGIRVVLSGVEEVNEVLANIHPTNDTHIFLTPEASNLKIFKSKLDTVKWLKGRNINHPKTIDLDAPTDEADPLKFPLVVKPKIGKGSEGVKILSKLEELKIFRRIGNYLAQELIGTKESEYTCGVYKSKFGYTKVIVMQRYLHNGSTCYAKVVKNELIEKYCQQIAGELETTAPFNIQLRLSENDTPYCFEINMRLSGTTSIRHNFGFRDCEVWINEQVLGQNAMSLFSITPGVAIRYEAEAYFNINDLDSISESYAKTLENFE